MTGATTLVASSQDDTPGAGVAMGMNFPFEAATYTHVSASPDGFVRLQTNTTAAASQFTNAITSTTNVPKIYPWWDDLATGTTGNVRGLLTTVNGIQAYVIQWFVTMPRNTTGAANATMQVALYNTGRIDYIYGSGAGTTSASAGATGLTATQFQSFSGASSHTSSTVTANNSLTTTNWPGAGRVYTLNPPAPCAGPINAGTAPSPIGTCNGSTATLTASGLSGGTGITLQWEESPDGINSWANVVGGTGATTTSYTTTAVNATRYFRLRTTCSNGPATNVTNVVTVNVVTCTYDVALGGASYTSIMPANGGTGTVFPGWINTSGDDNTSTTVSLTGTSFTYQGQSVAGFQSCINGWMTFNTANTSTAFSNNLTAAAPNRVLAPFWDDLVVTGQVFANMNASMRYQISGTLGSGSAVITVEWAGMERFNNPGPDLNFQVKLYESGNIIEFVYGSFEGYDGTNNSAYSYSIGYNGATPTGTTPADRFMMQTAFTNHWGTTNQTNQIVMPSCNTKFTLTPGTYTGPVSAPTIPAPSNDNSAAAVGLTVNNGPCTQLCATYYTSRSATNSGLGQAGCTTTAGFEDDDVWFSFVSNGTNNYLLTLRNSPAYDGVLQLFQADATTNIACVNATAGGLTETYTTSGLAAGTYYIRVFHNGIGIGTSSGQFSLCVSEVVAPPANDNICGAIALTTSPACVNTAGNTLNATGSPQAACAGLADDDIWYSFVAQTTGDLVTVQSVGSFNAHLQVFSSSDQTCTGTLTSLACVNNTSTGGAEIYSGPWVIGNTYFARVYHTLSGAADGTFTICVTATAPSCATGASPANAAAICSNAVTQNISWNATSGASGYDVYFDAGAGPATTLVSSDQAGLSYAASTPAPGQYTYRIVPRNTVGPAVGCTDITFTVNAVPVATITADGPTAFCAPGSVQLTASAGGSYLWSPGGATTQAITVSTSGSYTVQVTTAGCSGTSTATVVTVNTSPTITSTTATPGTVCAGSPSQLQVTVPAAQAYCTTVNFTTGVEAISNVTFANINNNSACAVGAGAGGALQDFTAIVGNVVAGNSYTITSTGTTDGSFTNNFAVFFDWNQDGIFETVTQIGSITNTVCTATTSTNITVPAGAVNGTSRMRVVKVFASIPTNPCGTYGYGQAEDYTLSVTGGAAPFTYSWSPAGTLNNASIANPIATPTETTEYEVTVTAGNGCTATGTATVTIDETDTDGDGIFDCIDNCPNVTGQQGSICDSDPNPNQFALGELDANCNCQPAACTQNLTMEFQTDGAGSQTSYEILPQGIELVVCSGTGFPNNAVITTTCCLPEGCYRLRVLDSAGDGMTTGTTGGYTLRTTGTNQRIIDNRNNFNGDFDGSVSTISGDQGFCLPIGSDRLIFTSCDKLDWVSNQFIIASLNPAVTAVHVPNAPNNAQSANSGYEFWFFDPNGSYSFRILRSHATSHGFGTGAARAAHLRLNNWGAINQIPEGVLLNVRVRGVVNGVAAEWGPACRFMVDPVAAACPRTKLIDIPYNQFISCGETRDFAPGQYVHAIPVSGATQYQFRFRQPGENFEKVRGSSTYIVQLWWAVDPLVAGTQYEVDVRAFKNGQWCPWGDICTLNIDEAQDMVAGNDQNSMTNTTYGAELNMWPNPNNGDQLYITLSEVPADAQTVSVDMFDLYGKRVMTRTVAAQDGFMNTVLDLNGDLAAGLYMVNITVGEKRWTERLVIAR